MCVSLSPMPPTFPRHLQGKVGLGPLCLLSQKSLHIGSQAYRCCDQERDELDPSFLVNSKGETNSVLLSLSFFTLQISSVGSRFDMLCTHCAVQSSLQLPQRTLLGSIGHQTHWGMNDKASRQTRQRDTGSNTESQSQLRKGT